MNKEVALVVFSGGQDSTTCLFWAKREFKRVVALSFLYGQKHEKEVELAREIARKADVEFEAMDVSFIGKLGHNSLTDTTMLMDQEKPAGSYPNTFVPGRNLFFLSIAAVYAREHGINHIVTGVSQTDFSGCNKVLHLFCLRCQVAVGILRDQLDALRVGDLLHPLFQIDVEFKAAAPVGKSDHNLFPLRRGRCIRCGRCGRLRLRISALRLTAGAAKQ